MEFQVFKSLVHNYLVEDLQVKLQRLKQEVAEVREGQAANGKSAMGDKYETSGEMARQELDKLQAQEGLLKQQLVLLNRMKPKLDQKDIGLGSLVQAGDLLFYISIPAGKIVVNNKKVYCISAGSPIGKELIMLKLNDIFFFNEQKITVSSIA